jgi:hypothetical protein
MTPRPSDRAEGLVLHFNGSSWSKLDIGAMPPLYAVWGSSATDVFAAGAEGKILHFDGQSWAAQTTTAPVFRGLWGSSGSDVYAVGAASSVWHYDGMTWSQVTVPAGDFYAIWGSGSGDVFVAGNVGKIIHYDGMTWGVQTTGTTTSFLTLFGTGPGSVYVAGPDVYQGTTVLRYNGSTWSLFADSTSHPLFKNLPATALWGTGDGLYLASDRYTIARYSSGIWSMAVNAADLFDVRLTSSSQAFAVGDLGTVLRLNGSTISDVPTGVSSTLISIWGDTPNNLVVGGSTGTLRYDGVSWSMSDPGFTAAGLWGTGSDNVAALLGDGRIRRFNGMTWTQERAAGSNEFMYDIFGLGSTNILAVGQQGSVGVNGGVIRYDGGQWKTEATGVSSPWYGVWGERPDSIFLAGFNNSFKGIIRLYNGTTWVPMTVPDGDVLTRIRGVASSDVYAVGSSGRILRFNGSAWTGASLVPVQLRSIAVSQTVGYVVGERGTVLIGTR